MLAYETCPIAVRRTSRKPIIFLLTLRQPPSANPCRTVIGDVLCRSDMTKPCQLAPFDGSEKRFLGTILGSRSLSRRKRVRRSLISTSSSLCIEVRAENCRKVTLWNLAVMDKQVRTVSESHDIHVFLFPRRFITIHDLPPVHPLPLLVPLHPMMKIPVTAPTSYTGSHIFLPTGVINHSFGPVTSQKQPISLFVL